MTPLRLGTLALALVATTACGAKSTDSAGSPDDWQVPLEDLGSPRVGAPTTTIAETATLWTASENVLPGIVWDEPGIDLPLYLFDTIALDPGVANEGSCPYSVLAGSSVTWASNCRSTFGYEWTGGVDQDTWTRGDLTYTRWDFDLDIQGDVEDPEFQRLSLQGAIVYVRGENEELERAVQANIEATLVGYWSRANATDPREAEWADWAWTGRDEKDAMGVHKIDGNGRLATTGTTHFVADALQVTTNCTQSPTGTVAVTGQDGAGTMRFHGDTDCRPCADVTVDGADLGETCNR